MHIEKNTNYESPKVEVMGVVTEGTIAVSLRFEEELKWNPDPDPDPKPYDGDIWVNF
jgi:hypothetical protein